MQYLRNNLGTKSMFLQSTYIVVRSRRMLHVPGSYGSTTVFAESSSPSIGQPGMQRMKSIARSKFIYWPNTDLHIEDYVRKCDDCAVASKAPQKTTLSSLLAYTFSTVDQATFCYAGPIQGRYFLVIDSWCSFKIVLNIRYHRFNGNNDHKKIARIHRTFRLSSNSDYRQHRSIRFGNLKSTVSSTI